MRPSYHNFQASISTTRSQNEAYQPSPTPAAASRPLWHHLATGRQPSLPLHGPDPIRPSRTVPTAPVAARPSAPTSTRPGTLFGFGRFSGNSNSNSSALSDDSHAASLPPLQQCSAHKPALMMSVAYEPRNFIHEGAYPPIDDDHDAGVDQRFTDSDVAEQLSHYTTEAAMLPDSRDVMGDDRDILQHDDSDVHDASRLDLSASGFGSPLHVSIQANTLSDPLHDSKEPSPGTESSPSSRVKPIPKPNRNVDKQVDGKFHCPLEDCKEDVKAFSRKCEWNKHMDKHERPYRCPAEGCENLPGFTYSGGLLRHEREVHGKHGGPKNTVNCPHPNCKRHTGKGFSRQENLNEHLRRVHTNVDGTTPPAEMVNSPDDNDSERSGAKRKRRFSDSNSHDELTELRDEIKRVREENEKLKSDMEQQSQHSLAMMAQIAELQDALRHGLSPQSISAPTAQMI